MALQERLNSDSCVFKLILILLTNEMFANNKFISLVIQEEAG